VDQDKATALVEQANRVHGTAAGHRPVAGVVVHMLGPEAGWAMVGVAVAGDQQATVIATEDFERAREARQEAPRFVEPNRARSGDPSAGSPPRALVSGRRSRYLLEKTYPPGRCIRNVTRCSPRRWSWEAVTDYLPQ
jgi:hypothetical protein